MGVCAFGLLFVSVSPPMESVLAYLTYHSLRPIELVPAYPLDGARILVAALRLCGSAPRRTAYIIVAISLPVGVAITGVGIWYALVVGDALVWLSVLVGIHVLMQAKLVGALASCGRASEHPLFT